MIIDDQPGVRRLLCEALKQLGYIPCEAKDGAEALEKIKNETPVLVILDLKMPGMSGVEFLKNVRRLAVHLPAIVITAYNELDFRCQLEGLGVRYILQKPFDIRQLYRAVEEALQTGKYNLQGAGPI
ncbi:Sporulation initiation phosphotransferase F [Moorella humiferrea]|uniref:Stage 0 sporulation protein A homolog n=1 Tax=Neomoorella humiferrea TaxID=676965 RepID=A0A2T0AL11_9FIRM|nr:response regulator [Moorella humiferrea]PRR69279.1 Sporulation initiation phosphotransferase F [Moorella humiferrea]